MEISTVTVTASANIALVKYWGKRDAENNLPATGSLSLGMQDLTTTTTLSLAEKDHINSDLGSSANDRIVQFLDTARSQFKFDRGIEVSTHNNFPTGTGLASSASGFAALALALNELLQLNLDRKTISQLARQGSGSAARSVYGGFVELYADEGFAEPIMTAESWPLDIIVAVTDQSEKSIGSTAAMIRTAKTSPYYARWLQSHDEDLTLARQAISAKDFQKLADVSEHNCLKMHAAIMTSQPSIVYWLPATLAVMNEVTKLRVSGTPCFYTIDAGAQVKIICEAAHTQRLRTTLAGIPGVERCLTTQVGGEPQIEHS